MINIFIVRHALSEANKINCFSGRSDVPLSDEGKIQAKKLAEYFLSNYKINKLYSSGLSRTNGTILPISEKTGLTILAKPEFIEIDVGRWEGVNYYKVIEEYPAEMKIWRENIGMVHCPEGESMAEVYKRAELGLKKIAREAKEEDSILISTHGGVIRCIQSIVKNVPLEKMYTINWVNNASLSQITYENGIFTPIFFGKDDYLQ